MIHSLAQMSQFESFRRVTTMAVLGVIFICLAAPASAAPVFFQNGTAQFSQGGYSPDEVHDGDVTVTSGNGWANSGNGANIAVWETTADSPVGGYMTNLTFTLLSGGHTPIHTLGKFRLSVTNANRTLFANGNDSFGFASPGVGSETGVTWTQLTPLLITSTNSNTTFSVSSNAVLAGGGPIATTETYTFYAETPLMGITGVRLEALTDGSLPGPFGGPGRSTSNGNFVLIEMTLDLTVTPVPEPASASLLLGVLPAALVYRRQRARR